MNSPLLTLNEFADALRVKPCTIKKWVYQKKIHPVRFCRRLFFERSEAERVIEESREK